MNRSYAAGNAFRIIGMVLAIVAGLAFIAAGIGMFLTPAPLVTDGPEALRAQALIGLGKTIGAVLSLVVGGALWLVAMLTFRYGRRHVLELAGESGATRDPILYLRDFTSDLASGLARMSISSEEEQLMKALRRVGTAVAIGRPKENLPQIGAPRIYYNDNEWRDRVGELIRAASLVVIRTGIGDGLRWEVEHVVRSVPPEQLIVAVSTPAAFQTFRTSTTSVVRWPPKDPRFERCLGASIRGFVIFDHHWSPTCIHLKRFSLLRSGPFHHLEFRSALKPILKSLGG